MDNISFFSNRSRTKKEEIKNNKKQENVEMNDLIIPLRKWVLDRQPKKIDQTKEQYDQKEWIQMEEITTNWDAVRQNTFNIRENFWVDESDPFRQREYYFVTIEHNDMENDTYDLVPKDVDNLHHNHNIENSKNSWYTKKTIFNLLKCQKFIQIKLKLF